MGHQSRKLALGLIGVLACNTEPPIPTELRFVSGIGESGIAPVGFVLSRVVVQVSDAHGPVAGATVTFEVETGGGGLSSNTQLSDAAGRAAVAWALGGLIGEQRLRVTAGLAPALFITVRAFIGPPAQFTAISTTHQFGVVSRPVTDLPTVRLTDAFGNPVANHQALFTVAVGGGSITDSLPFTDADGRARLGGWTLRSEAGLNSVRIGGLTFTAIGTPALLIPIEGMDETISIGAATSTPPAVLAVDGDGAPLRNVPVTFRPMDGSGEVLGRVQTTDSTGVARAGRWTVGMTPGPNTVVAETPGIPAVTFVALGTEVPPIPAAAMVPVEWVGESGFLGNFLLKTPAVQLTDAAGQPVARQEVIFRTTEGNGSVHGASVLSDTDGLARLGAWRLGPQVGIQRVMATTADLPGVAFEADATLPPPREFQLDVRYIGEPSESQRPAFDRAVLRWQHIILGDLPDVQLTTSVAWDCPAVSEMVDDVIVFIELGDIDGPGGILGWAGPCHVRAESKLPLMGHVQIDTADIRRLESMHLVESLVVHEIGHVLGIGSLWGRLVTGRGSSDPLYQGAGARAAWAMISQSTMSPLPLVPVENSPRRGTRDAHWRESVFETEVMTGYIDPGFAPISAITVMSLRDLGYVVDDATSDWYTLPVLLSGLGHAPIRLEEAPPPGPIFLVSKDGTRVGQIPR